MIRMTKFSLNFLLLLSLLWACSSPQGSNEETTEAAQEEMNEKPAVSEDGCYGAAISGKNPIMVDSLVTMLDHQDSVWVTFKSKIVANCQHSGCWMDLDLGNEKVVKVTFKDYAFFIPLDSQGKTATVEGYGKKVLIPVDMLKHYAEDDGQPQEEIDAITEPELAYTFEAIGVIIED